LSLANARGTIFRKLEDDEAFETILAEQLNLHACRLLACQLLPINWFLVHYPTEVGGMSNFLRWVSLTERMRLQAQYQTGGQGHIDQRRFKSSPIESDEDLPLGRYIERNGGRMVLVS
jgi:putative transposase